MKTVLKALAVSAALSFAFAASAESLLSSPDFSAANGWSIYIHQPAKDAGSTGVFENGAAVVKSAACEKQNPTNIQLIKQIDLEAGKSYKLKFTAKADKDASAVVAYCLSKAPYTNYIQAASVKLASGEKEYELTLPVKADKDGGFDSPRSIRFFFGSNVDGSVSISNVSIEEVK